MKQYICKESFPLETVDDDGFHTEDFMWIEKGSVWELSEDPYRFVGGPQTVHLDGDNYQWLEITVEHLNMYFMEHEALGQYQV